MDRLMNSDYQCPVCGSSQFVYGSLTNVHFRPDDVGFWSLSQGLSIRGGMCPVCGHLSLSGDPEKLMAMVRADKAKQIEEPSGVSETGMLSLAEPSAEEGALSVAEGRRGEGAEVERAGKGDGEPV